MGEVAWLDHLGAGTNGRTDESRAGRDEVYAAGNRRRHELITGRDRFERELERGRALEYFAIVVEATWDDIQGGRYRSRMITKAAVESITTFSIRYRCPFWFAGSVWEAARITESLLTKFVREQVFHVKQRKERIYAETDI